MKKAKLLLLLLPLFLLSMTSCVKQKKCEDSITGILVVCEKPYIEPRGQGKKVYALFYQGVSEISNQMMPYCVINKLPNDFSEGDTLPVIATLKHLGFHNMYDPVSIKITCIVKNDY